MKIVFDVLAEAKKHNEPSYWTAGYKTACNEIVARLHQAEMESDRPVQPTVLRAERVDG